MTNLKSLQCKHSRTPTITPNLQHTVQGPGQGLALDTTLALALTLLGHYSRARTFYIPYSTATHVSDSESGQSSPHISYHLTLFTSRCQFPSPRVASTTAQESL